MGRLGCQRMRARLADPHCLFVEVGRVEAHDAGQSLAMGETRIRCHQRIGMFGLHLDMIAEHAIMLDAERGNAGFLAVARLQCRDRLTAFAALAAQYVELGIIALGDIAALCAVDRRGRDQRALQKVNQRLMAGEGGEQAFEQARCRRDPTEHRMERLALLKPVTQLAQIARASAPGDQPAKRPADIGQGAQCGAHPVAQRSVALEQRDEVEPFINRRDIGERCRDVGAEQPCGRSNRAGCPCGCPPG